MFPERIQASVNTPEVSELRLGGTHEAGSTLMRINVFSTLTDLSWAFQLHPILSVTHRQRPALTHRLDLSYQSQP